jgi:CheY-like chemotaxis protein
VPERAKALLVDDRKDNLLALEAILQGLPVTPVAVESGEAALKQLLTDDFAVILLDAQMPNMDGFETASHIKRRERTRHVPILFLTAADRDAQLALRGYAVGAVDYLTKPFDPWVLRAKVSIFVELWTKTQQLKSQAEAVRERDTQWQKLTDTVDEAARVLRSWRGHAGETRRQLLTYGVSTALRACRSTALGRNPTSELTTAPRSKKSNVGMDITR